MAEHAQPADEELKNHGDALEDALVPSKEQPAEGTQEPAPSGNEKE